LKLIKIENDHHRDSHGQAQLKGEWISRSLEDRRGHCLKNPNYFDKWRFRWPDHKLARGIHGDEYEGILAIWKLTSELSPSQLSGTVIATPIVHMAAFRAGTRESPIDGKNLARVFPGDPNGSVTDRIAHTFLNEIVLKCSFVAGLHSGGCQYKFHPLIEYYKGISRVIDNQARAAAESFAIGPFDIVQQLPVPPPNMTCTYEAARNHIVGIEPEMWGEGRCIEEHVEEYVDSLRNLLVHLGMVRGKVKRNKFDHVRGEWVYPKNTGLFVPSVKIRDKVGKGTKLGKIIGDQGVIIEEIIAPTSGFVGAIRTFPLIKLGDWAILIEMPAP
jgi:N-alpha-acetyl-L-2,4-diaminobutyrate deacetylase